VKGVKRRDNKGGKKIPGPKAFLYPSSTPPSERMTKDDRKARGGECKSNGWALLRSWGTDGGADQVYTGGVRERGGTREAQSKKKKKGSGE